MARPDRVFKQTCAWFKASLARALAASAIPAAQRPAIEQLMWQMLGVLNPAALAADPDLDDFRDTSADARSLAVALQVIGESLVALDYVKQAVDATQAGGSPAAALDVVAPVMDQIERLRLLAPGSRYPSAIALGKMLLTLSGDAGANPAAGREAEKLASLTGAAGAGAIDNAQTALALVAMVVGSAIDRAFAVPSNAPSAGFLQQALPDLAGAPQIAVAGPAGLGVTLQLNPAAPSGVKAALALALDSKRSQDGQSFQIGMTSSTGVGVFVPVAPPGPPRISGAFDLGISVSRSNPNGTLVIDSTALGAKLAIGELGAALRLRNGAPSLGFYARKGKATITPDNPFLKLILGDGITLEFDVEAEADIAGHLRLTNGTGLKASLPVPTLPTGPFDLQLINLGLEPVGGSFLHLQLELSASFGVALGPFAASVERLGVLLDLDVANAGRPVAFAFKPPSGIGLVLDAGIVKGGGYLSVDADGYAGVLELRMLAVDVKAIAILSTKSEAGFSLLLLIFGQFPAIQLSFGFTLTGVGGLIGVQHTASPPALSQGLSNGSLDAVLFPDNPVGDAPRIIATLRVLFPTKRGGFVIGPMLELGWGTPSLVTVRLGMLVEANQFVLLGQAIIALPPLLSADLAILYLRLDFVGAVIFDPLQIRFDAKLINSRVAFISITGQFAFRASFGANPTFLISAGGFHPRFKEVPSDIPSPFDRVGASFDIGIVGVSLKGYFAITSATVQTGAELKVWADIGIAGIEGGFGFDAICYLVPKFYFELDLHAYLAVYVFGMDFASVHLDGLLAGPGRWRIAGRASVHTPWPLPDFSLHVDEEWGPDRETPVVTIDIAAELAKEIAKIANWSAQLPKGGESYVTLAEIKVATDLLAHPLGSLVFQQKLLPLELRLAKASGSVIKGANEFFGAALVFAASRRRRAAEQAGVGALGFLRRRAVPGDVAGRPDDQAVVRIVHRGIRAQRRCLRARRDRRGDAQLRGGRSRRAAAFEKAAANGDGRLLRSEARAADAPRLGGSIAAARQSARAARDALGNARQSRADGRRRQEQPAAGRALGGPLELLEGRPGTAPRSGSRRRGEPGGGNRGGDRMTIPYRFLPWSRRGLARRTPTRMRQARRSRLGRRSRSASRCRRSRMATSSPRSQATSTSRSTGPPTSSASIRASSCAPIPSPTSPTSSRTISRSSISIRPIFPGC